jgi:NAD(P)-dependent dehydrogenase (short-subunit alcohol dehydrogenase family)
MSVSSTHPLRLQDRVAVVTGAGSTADGEIVGIGRGIATQLSREGAKLVLVDLDRERVAETMDAIRSEGGQAIVVEGDVAREEDCRRIYEEAKAQIGDVSLLVNNVGITSGGGNIEALDMSAWNNVLAVNLTGALQMAKHAIPHFRAAGRGAMVHISSIGGIRAAGAGVSYASSKAGLIALSRELALMYGRERFRSNVIAPGHVFTPYIIATFNEERRAQRRKVAPLNIEGNAWDIARAAAFLLSDDARFITGVCLPVDGGVTQIGAFATHSLMTGADE